MGLFNNLCFARKILLDPSACQLTSWLFHSKGTHRTDEFVSRNNCLHKSGCAVRLLSVFCPAQFAGTHVALKYVKEIVESVHEKTDGMTGFCEWRITQSGQIMKGKTGKRNTAQKVKVHFVLFQQ